jgi:CheY-like chemotaxis protein
MVAAGTVREAEDVLERLHPRAIVLDIVLRSEDTWAFAARLKRDERTKDIPVLMASTVEDRNKGFHLGVDAYLLKPFEKPELIGQLRALTGETGVTKVLIIDDKESDRYLLKQYLRHLRLLILEAAEGIGGVQMASRHLPDFIFLDLAMGDISGFEVLKKLREQPATAHTPVIIITSQVLSNIEKELLLARATAIIGKDRLEETDFGETLRNARLTKSSSVAMPR